MNGALTIYDLDELKRKAAEYDALAEKLRAAEERAAKLEAAIREHVSPLLDSMETCHICKGLLSLDDRDATHCENCSWDCDEHELPNCSPLYVLHGEAKRAIAAALDRTPEPAKEPK